MCQSVCFRQFRNDLFCHCADTDFVQIERLDMINAPAPIAPELAFKEEEHSKSRQSELRKSKVF